MKKLVVFDLDGVLVDIKDVHYKALNLALPDNYKISLSEHYSTYDGLKTNDKLKKLTIEKNLPSSDHETIFNLKQSKTLELIKAIEEDNTLKNLLEILSNKGIKLALCTNSIRKTTLTILSKLGVIEYFDYIVTNEDVINSKPHPEIYWKVMTYFGVTPKETLIFEDSPNGLKAAQISNASVIRIKNSKDLKEKLNSDIIMNIVNKNEQIWEDDSLNVLIPMAGAGSRFEKAGYTFPKPLIEVMGKPMIQVVCENLSIKANYIFIVQSKHNAEYNIEAMLRVISPGCKVVLVDGITEGAACTALLAKEHINNESPLFFANSDQYVYWNSSEFMYKMQETNMDGGIVTFKATHPKWSFAKIGEDGLVNKVAEKNPISDNATVGFYYWKYGKDFVKYAEQMIDKDIRVNNEFYVCPVFNEAIQDGKKILPFEAQNMYGLGTPEDLQSFLRDHKEI